MAMSNDIFPPFSTIKYLYDNNAYTDLDIYTFVELECLTKEQYTEITGEIFPQETEENDFTKQPKPYQSISDIE